MIDNTPEKNLTIPSVQEIVAQLSAVSTSKKELAIALHDYVRDNINFGFTPYFDYASVEKTLFLKTEHCNPQARLMVALFREAGFEARFQPVTITNAVLREAVEMPRRLSHVFTEVKMNNKWVRLDSYIADPALRERATAKLKSKSKELGYGLHVSATGIWDGESDSFSQIAGSHLIVQVHAAFDSLGNFYKPDAYLHKFGPVTYSTFFGIGRVTPKTLMKILNRRVNKLRNARLS